MKIFSNCDIEKNLSEIDIESGIEMAIILDNSREISIEDFNKIEQGIYRRRDIRVISIGKPEDRVKSIIRLMISIGNFNVYEVAEKDIIDGEYLNRVEKGNPDIYEVKQFLTKEYIDGNIREIINNIFNKRESKEEFEKYVEENGNILKGLIDYVDYVRMEQDNCIKDKVDYIENELKTKIGELEADIDRITREKAELENFNKSHSSSNDSGNHKNDSYVTINIRNIDCRPENIIYFKELSYVTGVNTLIKVIEHTFESKEESYKLIIVDSDENNICKYTDITKTSEIEGFNNKDEVVLNSNEVVIDNMKIGYIKTVLESSRKFDNVIIYDRCRKVEDIVVGLKVNKIIVINSQSEYEQCKARFGLKELDKKIMSEFSECKDDGTIIIEKIQGFNRDDAISAKAFKYRKILDRKTGKPIIFTITGSI